jgi:hypothetical protein
MKLQAPGPFYQIFHFITSSFTGYDVVWMRIITITTLLVCIYFSKKIVELENQQSEVKYENMALLFFVIPTTWVYGTMAITQVPAMFCALGFVLLFNKQNHFNAFILGILLGLSILGRVHYGAFALLCLFDVLRNLDRNVLIKNSIIISTAMLICLPVFMIWQGYVPPDHQAQFSDTTQLNFSSAFTGAIYLFLFTIILVPKLLVQRINAYFFAIFVGLFLLNFSFNLFPKSAVVISALLKFLPERLISAVPIPLYSTIAVFVIYHYINLKEIFAMKAKGVFGIIVILTIASGLMSRQFSDGYVFQVLPLIIVFNYEKIESKMFVPKYVFFSCVGFIYLLYRMSIIYN